MAELALGRTRNLGRLTFVNINLLSSTSRGVSRLISTCAGALVLWAGLGACDRKVETGRDSSTGESARAAGITDSTAERKGSGWTIEAGPFLVLPTVDGGMTAGSLVRANATDETVGDTAGVGSMLGNGQFELFARGGRVGGARVNIEATAALDSGCTAWPVARLSIDGGSAPPWTVAFATGKVTAIVLDSIEGMSPRDSARLAIDLTRLASALKDDTVATFRGLPFVVLRAWRARGLDTGFVVATLARRVNQEDAPREERLVMVVDQIGGDSKNWVVAWHERASGSEEELVVAEPLLSFRSGKSKDVHLLFGRDDGVALSAAVLTRSATGWHVLWESAIAGCD